MSSLQPPWYLFAVFRESDREKVLAELESSRIRYQIKHEPSEAKPYQLYIHDDDTQLAADTLFRTPR
jgi:hypothetical protein